MTQSLRAKALTVAIASAAVFGFTAGTAQADVLATSMIQLDGFLLKKGPGGPVLDSSDFSFLTYTNTGDVSASFAGFAGASSPSGTGTPLDLALVCSGPSCGGPNSPPAGLTENGFQPLGSPGLLGNFAAADQNESGAPITGIGIGTPAKVESAAYIQIGYPNGGVASGTANNGLSGTFEFTLASATAIDLSFLANYYNEVYVSAGEVFPAFAQSRGNVSFTFRNLSAGGALVDTYAPTALNWNNALNAPLPGAFSISDSGVGVAFAHLTPVLTAGTLYQFSFSVQNLADGQRVVPEPGTLALVGLTLVGLGLTRRRLQRDVKA